MTIVGAVELMAVLTMLLGTAVIVWTRRARGIGIRITQFAVVVLGLPVVLILALESKSPSGVTGTLLGAVVGCVLSSVGDGGEQHAT